MTIDEQHAALLELEKEIDKRLQNTDFASMKELLLFLAQSKTYEKFTKKNTRIYLMKLYIMIWLEEKRKLEDIGIKEDIFCNINSLDDVEIKFHSILYSVLRFETEMPEEYYEQAIDNLLETKASGIALAHIIVSETYCKINNTISIGRRLNARGETVRAIILLQKMEEFYPKDADILKELAGCWMDGQQWERALECLRKIEKPDEDVKAAVDELEKVLKR